MTKQPITDVTTRPSNAPFSTDTFQTQMAASVLIGLIFAGYLFSFAFLTGHGSVTRWPMGDMRSYLTAAKYFIYDDWRFPIFTTHFIVEHANVESMVFSDIIPIFALVTKAIYKATGVEIVYLPLWYFIATALQPLGFFLLLWAMRVRKPLYTICGSLLAIAVPTFLYRIGHAPLYGHFTILTSMALYFAFVNGSTEHRQKLSRAWLAVILFIAMVNLYLLAMCMGLFSAAVLQVAVNERRNGRPEAAVALGRFYAAVFVALIALFWVCGYFVPHLSGGTMGWNSSNILSPVIPRFSSLLKDATPLVEATGGQYEGYNYFGAGVLLLCFFALMVGDLTRLREFKRQHASLLALMLVFFLLAASNKAYIGRIHLWSFDVPSFTGVFRSSGRFVWPITYLCLALCFRLLDGRLRQRQAIALFGVCLALQWMDVQDLRQGIWNMGHQQRKPELQTNPQAFRALIERHAGVHITPDWACSRVKHVNDMIEDIAWYSATVKRAINTLYLARAPVDWSCGPHPISQEAALSNTAKSLENGYLAIAFYDKDTPLGDHHHDACLDKGDFTVCLDSKKEKIEPRELESLFSDQAVDEPASPTHSGDPVPYSRDVDW